MTWEVKELNKIGNIFSGNSINAKTKKEKYRDISEGLPYVATKDVSYESVIDYDNGVKIPEKDLDKFRIAHKNSILICAEGGSAGRKLAFNTKNICFVNKLFALEPFDFMEPRYIFYFYQTYDFQEQFKSKMTGLIGGVSMGKFKNIEIPVPPIQIQKQIVAILDKAFEKLSKAKENAEKNLNNAKEVFESYLQKVFEELREDSDNTNLGKVCDFVRGPFGGSLKKSYFVPEGYAVYEQQHAINDQFDNIRYFIDDKKFQEMQRFELKFGDLIMSCSGTMGKIAIVPKNIKQGIINQALLKLTPHKNLNINFLKTWMESQDFQDQLNKFSKGAAIKNVASVKTLKEIKVPIPSIDNQNKVISKLDNLSEQTKQLENIYSQKLSSLEELKQSILQKAFKGELTEAAE